MSQGNREFLHVLVIISFGVLGSACAPEIGKPKAPPEGPFTVSEYFAASGAMGDGAVEKNLVISEGEGCKERPGGARGNCYSFKYVATEPYTTPSGIQGICSWAGVFWQYPVNNWGGEPGLPIPGDKLQKVSFYAAVAGESESVTFQIGGIGTKPNEPKPAQGCPPSDLEPGENYDQVLNSSVQTLSSEWTKVEIPLKARYADTPITQLIGALAWSVNGVSGLPKTIYIDDLVYE